MCLDPIIEKEELSHDQAKQGTLFKSECCGADLQDHFPCFKVTQCSKCLDCPHCGGPNGNAEAETIQEWERKHGR